MAATPTSNSSGSQTCTISTEHTLATIAAAGVYVCKLDVSALADGATPDILEVRTYSKARSGDTERLEKVFTLVGAQGEPSVATLPVVTDNHWKVTIKQTQGTGRAILWNALAL
jgi:hypothetical protein